MSTDHVIPEVVDLTEPSDSPRLAEVLTPAGLVRVHSMPPVVKVEIDPNVEGHAVTHPGGHWRSRSRMRGTRIEVILTRLSDGDDHG